MRLLVAIVVTVMMPAMVIGQDKPKDAMACLERFMSNSHRLSSNCAMYAQLEATETSPTSAGPLEIEWFKLSGTQKDRTVNSYLEIRYLYPDRAENEVWEKVLQAGRDRYLCRGWAHQKMHSIPIVDEDDDKQAVYRNSPLFHVPDVVALALLPNSQFLIKRDQESHLDRWVHFVLEDFSQKETGAGFVGVWLSGQYFLEITFAKDQFYMPTEVRAFYPTKEKPTPDADPKDLLIDKAYDVRTKWRSTEGNSPIFYPVSIVNTVHKVNPSSKNGREMEIRASWQVGSIDAKSITLEKLNVIGDKSEFFPIKEDLKKSFAKLNR